MLLEFYMSQIFHCSFQLVLTVVVYSSFVAVMIISRSVRRQLHLHSRKILHKRLMDTPEAYDRAIEAERKANPDLQGGTSATVVADMKWSPFHGT